MQKQRSSTNLRQKLPLPAYQPVDRTAGEFVETIREAVRALPGSGSKRHRLLYSPDNVASALQGLLQEALSGGATADDLMRVDSSITRAIKGLIRSLGLFRAVACYKTAIGAETASNGDQNNDSYRVLTSGTLGDLNELWESSRLQRDMSQSVMESVEVRIADLRAEARQ